MESGRSRSPHVDRPCSGHDLTEQLLDPGIHRLLLRPEDAGLATRVPGPVGRTACLSGYPTSGLGSRLPNHHDQQHPPCRGKPARRRRQAGSSCRSARLASSGGWAWTSGQRASRRKRAAASMSNRLDQLSPRSRGMGTFEVMAVAEHVHANLFARRSDVDLCRASPPVPTRRIGHSSRGLLRCDPEAPARPRADSELRPSETPRITDATSALDVDHREWNVFRLHARPPARRPVDAWRPTRNLPSTSGWRSTRGRSTRNPHDRPRTRRDHLGPTGRLERRRPQASDGQPCRMTAPAIPGASPATARHRGPVEH